jgi:hypothetical protein
LCASAQNVQVVQGAEPVELYVEPATQLARQSPSPIAEKPVRQSPQTALADAVQADVSSLCAAEQDVQAEQGL